MREIHDFSQAALGATGFLKMLRPTPEDVADDKAAFILSWANVDKDWRCMASPYNAFTEFLIVPASRIGKTWDWSCLFIHDTVGVSAYLQTKRWSDWTKIWWLNSWSSTGPIHALLNCHFILASDWSSSYCAFADKPLMGFGSNFVDQLRPDQLWLCSTKCLLFSGLLIGQAVSVHLQSNHWSDWE